MEERLRPDSPALLLVNPNQLIAGNLDDVCPFRSDRRDLLRGRTLRDADDTPNAEPAGGPRDGTPVVPRTQGRDPALPLLSAEAGDAVPCPPDLEDPEALEVLELQEHVAFRALHRDDRRTAGDLPHDGERRLDILQRHIDSVHVTTAATKFPGTASPRGASLAIPPRLAGAASRAPASPSRCSRGTSPPRSPAGTPTA